MLKRSRAHFRVSINSNLPEVDSRIDPVRRPFCGTCVLAVISPIASPEACAVRASLVARTFRPLAHHSQFLCLQWPISNAPRISAAFHPSSFILLFFPLSVAEGRPQKPRSMPAPVRFGFVFRQV